MPHLEYFLVSESISVDILTNRISLFHVLEEVGFPRVPFHISEFSISSAWDLEEEELGHEVHTSVRITVPGIEDPVLIPQDFLAERHRHRVNLGVLGLEVRDFGAILFELLLDGVHVASHRVNVIQRDLNPRTEMLPPPGAQPTQARGENTTAI